MTEPHVTFVVQLPKTLRQAIHKAAKSQDLSSSQLVRKLLRDQFPDTEEEEAWEEPESWKEVDRYRVRQRAEETAGEVGPDGLTEKQRYRYDVHCEDSRAAGEEPLSPAQWKERWG